ncbi:MAG: glycine--tRNA ligase subunit beta [Nitrospirota bacterium]|nr:glycine--tRNA ligase subunit beta [Nitrospirota bacterium]
MSGKQSASRQNREPEPGSSFLVEIGTEEIPARFLPSAISNLKEIAAKTLDEYRVGYGDIKAYATPRRLALIAGGVEAVQKDISKEIFGPSKKVAFDEQGNPSKAATGFAQSVGVDVSDLKVKMKGKAEYIAAVIEEKGVETKTILPEIAKKIILSLHFPKSMRWGNGSLHFARPISWILALFNNESVQFELDAIRSGNMTRGHRFLSPASFQIKSIDLYMRQLENNFVVLDQEKRKNSIRKNIAALFDDPVLQPIIDEELLEMVTYIVEYPVPVLCSFRAEYLRLPKELLITVMKDHQKYFGVQDSTGNLVNHFIVISNTKSENAETVRIGAERVIKARFDDAKFYYHEDTAKRLEERVDSLKVVTFHDKLGSLYEKTERIMSIADFLAEKISPSLKDTVSRAARLSKTDLITGVVREFPELQGIMGKYYATHDGEDSEVAAAIEEQYLPKNYGDRVPKTDTGAIVSLADRIDNISSFFSIGLIPTGSEDPFALRRQAMGIISIILEKGYALTLTEIFGHALTNLRNIHPAEKTFENITGFMEQRMEFILSSMGHEPDLIKSVISLSSVLPPKLITARLDALRKFRKDKVFPDFLLAVKRVNNITPKTPLPSVNPGLFIQEEEKNLHSAYVSLRDEYIPLTESEQFFEGLQIFSRITPHINSFFDKVMVMDKQEEIKTNRLALLKEIWESVSLMADFSKIQ